MGDQGNQVALELKRRRDRRRYQRIGFHNLRIQSASPRLNRETYGKNLLRRSEYALSLHKLYRIAHCARKSEILNNKTRSQSVYEQFLLWVLIKYRAIYYRIV